VRANPGGWTFTRWTTSTKIQNRPDQTPPPEPWVGIAGTDAPKGINQCYLRKRPNDGNEWTVVENPDTAPRITESVPVACLSCFICVSGPALLLGPSTEQLILGLFLLLRELSRKLASWLVDFCSTFLSDYSQRGHTVECAAEQ